MVLGDNDKGLRATLGVSSQGKYYWEVKKLETGQGDNRLFTIRYSEVNIGPGICSKSTAFIANSYQCRNGTRL